MHSLLWTDWAMFIRAGMRPVRSVQGLDEGHTGSRMLPKPQSRARVGHGHMVFCLRQTDNRDPTIRSLRVMRLTLLLSEICKTRVSQAALAVPSRRPDGACEVKRPKPMDRVVYADSSPNVSHSVQYPTDLQRE